MSHARPPVMKSSVIKLAVAALALSVAAGADARPKPNGPATDAERWAAWEKHQALEKASLFHGLEWRSIGPTGQGGRVVDVEAIPGDPYGYYVAYATGGVWKTTNNGTRFEPLSDTLPTLVTGDIAVDPNDAQRLWIGSGEPNSSRSSYGGLGVFRSDDGGKTFTHVGLSETDRISKVVVDPKNGNRVCVAALGKLYSQGGTRGVFCTADAGKTWNHVLKGATPWAGAIDLVMDPADANVMYAAFWDRARTPWNLVESGAGSGIWKTSDGGTTWARVGGGFPGHDKVGRIGLAISPAAPQTIYASVDDWGALPNELIDFGDRPLSLKRLKAMSKDEFLAQDPEEIETFIRSSDLDTTLDAKALVERVRGDDVAIGEIVKELEARDTGFGDVDIWGLSLWRSDDGGATWRRTHEAPIRDVTYTYGYYFGTVAVAPDNAEKVYLVGVPAIGSTDGGRTFESLQGADVHPDYHAWWIDPRDSRHMLLGNDGGVDASYDGGRTWQKLDAQPVGQFYTIAVDLADPYNVYGGLQDNGTLKGSSRARWELGEDWSVIGGGDGMHVAIDLRDGKTVYTGYQFGSYARADDGGRREVRPRPKLGEPPYRFNWNTPLVLSPHNQDLVYVGTNKLLRSTDRGETWTEISGDLTTSKARGDVPYATITSVSESALRFGLIWVGTDDGNVWVTRTAGDDWTKVDAKLPADRWVSRIVASSHVRDRAYVTLNGYRNDDITPYLYVTDDLGKSWRSLAAGLPAEAVNVVREDPVRADVLYVGTDRGVYVTLDRGASWTTLAANLPNVPVHDLAVHPRERELAAATHGRSVWVVDVLPVQELDTAKAVVLHPLAPLQSTREWRSRPSQWFDETPGLPALDLPFWAGADGRATVSVLDGEQRLVRRFDVDAKRGVNTATWDVLVERDLALAAERAARAKAAKEAKDATDKSAALAKTPYAESVRLGHRLFAIPGTYTIEVALNGERSSQKLEIKAPEARKPRVTPKPKLRGRDE